MSKTSRVKTKNMKLQNEQNNWAKKQIKNKIKNMKKKIIAKKKCKINKDGDSLT